MTHHRPHHHRGHGCGPRRERLPGNRAEWLARLEEHQRDLEQRTADVADLIRRLRDDEPAAATTTA
jgi:hypothetical protein